MRHSGGALVDEMRGDLKRADGAEQGSDRDHGVVHAEESPKVDLLAVHRTESEARKGGECGHAYLAGKSLDHVASDENVATTREETCVWTCGRAHRHVHPHVHSRAYRHVKRLMHAYAYASTWAYTSGCALTTAEQRNYSATQECS